MKPGMVLTLNHALDFSPACGTQQHLIELRRVLRHLDADCDALQINHTGANGCAFGIMICRWPGASPVFDRWLDQEIGL